MCTPWVVEAKFAVESRHDGSADMDLGPAAEVGAHDRAEGRGVEVTLDLSPWPDAHLLQVCFPKARFRVNSLRSRHAESMLSVTTHELVEALTGRLDVIDGVIDELGIDRSREVGELSLVLDTQILGQGLETMGFACERRGERFDVEKVAPLEVRPAAPPDDVDSRAASCRAGLAKRKKAQRLLRCLMRRNGFSSNGESWKVKPPTIDRSASFRGAPVAISSGVRGARETRAAS